MKAYLFLTTWGVHLTCLSQLLIFISSIIEHNSSRFWGERYLWRFTWVLFEILVPMNILITLVFWVFLYPDLIGRDFKTTQKVEFFTSHSLPLIVTQIDFWVNGWMFKYSHLVIVIGFAIVYMIVNLIATFALGTPLYPIITWKDWGTAIFVPCLMILIICLFLAFTWIS